ncbi:MAG: YMGG-like glycine zipper-containing protein [Rhodospirillaceae bacterium]
MKFDISSHPIRKAITMIACVSLVTSSLAGCSSRSERIGTDDGTDSCRSLVVALDSTGNYFAEDMIQGALIGAAGGALLGGLASGSWKGAAIGAAAGAVAGALGGYWKNKMDQGRDQAIVTVASDMRRENDQLDKTNAAFRQLADCRRNEAKRIKAQYAAKAITRDVAKSQLGNLAALARKDLDILNSILANSDKRANEYQYAAAQIDPTVPLPEEPAKVSKQVEAAPVKTVQHKQPTPHAPVSKVKATGPATTQEFVSMSAKRSEIAANRSNAQADIGGFETLS